MKKNRCGICGFNGKNCKCFSFIFELIEKVHKAYLKVFKRGE